MSDDAVNPVESPETHPLDRVPTWARAATILALTFVVYLPAMRGAWIWGDNERVYDNPFYKDVSGLRKLWVSREPKDYWPLFYTAFWVQWRLWGTETTGYHVVNVIWHGLVAVLLWRVLVRLRVPGAWLAGALFAVHPVHVDSVAWISEFVNPFSASFCLLALLCYLRCDERDSWAWYAASVLLFLLAMLSKASVAMLPAVLVLCRLWMSRPWRWRDAVRLGGLLVVAVSLSLVTVWFQKHSAGAHGYEWSAGFAERTAVAGHIIWFYLTKTLVPYKLMFVYPKWHIDPRSLTSYVPMAGVIALAGVFVWKWRVWGRCMFVGLGTFVVCLFPVLGYFDMFYMKYSYVADHWQYLASMGAIAWAVGLATWGTEWAASRLSGRAARWAPWERLLWGLTVVAIFGTITWRHAATYTDLERVWRDTLAVDNNVGMVHTNLGTLLGRRAQAMMAEARRDPAGSARAQADRLMKEAEQHYREALRIDPRDEDAHANLGALHFRRGDVTSAIAHYREALKIKPAHTGAHTKLAKAMLKLGQIDQAARHLDAVARMRSRSAPAQRDLANVLVMQGQWAEAVRGYRAALDLAPQDVVTLHRLAWLLATCPDDVVRNGTEALSLAQRACHLTDRNDPLALDALAAAHAEQGHYQQAEATIDAALRAARRQGAQAMIRGLAGRQAWYRTGKPLRIRPASPTSIPSDTAGGQR